MSSQLGAKPDTVSSNKRVGSSSLRKYSKEETIFTKKKKRVRERERKKDKIIHIFVGELYDPFWVMLKTKILALFVKKITVKSGIFVQDSSLEIKKKVRKTTVIAT